MKNLIGRTEKFLALMIAVYFGARSGHCSGAAEVARLETWRFDSGASVSAPEVTSNLTTAGQAAIQPGAFSGGWIAQNSILGDATGIWDLGRYGTIACSGLSPLLGSPGQERFIVVSVTQYDDGGIYSYHAAVSIPGATPIATNVLVTGACPIGSWVAEETRWRIPSESAVDSVVITSPYDGSLVDQVSIQTSAVSATPPQLSILNRGGFVKVSWPASYSGFVLESNASPDNSAGWSTVNDAVQSQGGVLFVELPATNGATFYRLRQ